MGAQTDAARAEVVAARNDLSTELDGLAGATRASLDIPTKIRESPGRTAALGAGAAFLILGGPGRLMRRARRLLFGSEKPLPKSMLPEEVERVVRSLGSDAGSVRAALERDFARYLDERGSLAARDVRRAATDTVAGLIRFAGRIIGFRLISRLLSAESPRAGAGMTRISQLIPTKLPRIFRRPF